MLLIVIACGRDYIELETRTHVISVFVGPNHLERVGSWIHPQQRIHRVIEREVLRCPVHVHSHVVDWIHQALGSHNVHR